MKIVFESLDDIFKPKSKDFLDKILKERNNMSYDEYQDFVKKLLPNIFSGRKLQKIKENINDVVISLNNIDVFGSSYNIYNIDKVYKINNDIGLKGKLMGRPGIFTDFVFTDHTGEPVIHASFVDMKGEKTEHVRILKGNTENNYVVLEKLEGYNSHLSSIGTLKALLQNVTWPNSLLAITPFEKLIR